ncbi:MAG: thioredoxin fold domain-containing protein [Bacilli bacterium]|nr:thioredoxin fold domain-containing protein [Bacilli bacterium]
MKGTLKNSIITLIVVIVLLLPILIDYYGDKRLEVVTYGNYTTEVESGEPSLIYYGDAEKDDFKNISKTLLAINKKFDINVKALNYNDLNEDQIAELLDQDDLKGSKTGLIFVKHRAVEYIHNGDVAKKDLEALVDKFFNNVILENEIAYKEPKDADSYKKIINNKKIVMTVFGRSTCSWCNDFKPVYNDIANKYKINVYIFESDLYNEEEYEKVMQLGLKIPKNCTDTGEVKNVADGFGTPLTLFTKSGKVIDCISGYMPRKSLESKLKSVGMIE